MVSLDADQWAMRSLLAEVAAGKIRCRQPESISYSELWEWFNEEAWHRSRTRAIVGQITKISAFEVQNHRPPLNEIVIPIGGKTPKESWESIRDHISTAFGVEMPYQSHEEAITACRAYWGNRDQARGIFSGSQAEEGFRQDRTSKFRKRNKALVAERKRLDGYACQACGFRLKVGGSFIIDCHHITPLGTQDTVVVTSIDDLVCLCPTCHRIAHSRPYPLSIQEIVEVRTRMTPIALS